MPIGRCFAMLLLACCASASAQVKELDKAACESQGGTQQCNTNGINGDGNIHDVTAPSPQGKPQLLGAYARTMRQGLDNDYRWRCMVDPPQPPTGENTWDRRCDDQARDMSVEKCTATSGSHPTLVCDYVNSTGARAKTVELCGCWK